MTSTRDQMERLAEEYVRDLNSEFKCSARIDFIAGYKAALESPEVRELVDLLREGSTPVTRLVATPWYIRVRKVLPNFKGSDHE